MPLAKFFQEIDFNLILKRAPVVVDDGNPTPLVRDNRRNDETTSYTVAQKLKCIWGLR